MNSNDLMREAILKYFYDLSKKALSMNRAKANELMTVKALVGSHARQDIISNLLYLIQTGYIKQEKIEKIPYYMISDKGISHFEGTSNFQKSHWVTGINVTNIQGVTVIGDHNFVHQEFNNLYKNLDLLKDEVSKSDSLTDKEKLDYQSDIETIKSQLAKEKPNKTIIQQAWSALSVLGTIDGIMSFYKTVEPHIAAFLN